MKESFMYNIGDIIELTQDEDNTNYGYVKILKYPDGTGHTGSAKHANLTLFRLVDRRIFYV